MKRGEIYYTKANIPERGSKPGYYVVVSRSFVAGNDDIATVTCAPVYTEILGLKSEVEVGVNEGLPHGSAIRCDFLALLFKRKLTEFIGTLPPDKIIELNRALRYALELGA